MPRREARQTEPGKLAGWSVTEIGAKAVRRQRLDRAAMQEL